MCMWTHNLLTLPKSRQPILSVTLYIVVTVAGSMSLSYPHVYFHSTGTFFCTQAATQSAPLSTIAVNPHAATALKAYSAEEKE